MLRYKSILIAAVLAAFMFVCFINSSNAQILIVDMYTPSEVYDDDYFYYFGYVKTDKPYDIVYWYIGDPNDPDDNFQYLGETLGDGVKTRAWFYTDASDCPGHIKGDKYRIGALADYYDEETEMWWDDWESRDFTVYKPISLSETGEKTGAYGYLEISKFYYDGSHIIMNSTIYAHNPTNNPKAKDRDEYRLIVAPWFWTQKYPAPNGQGGNEHRDTKPIEVIDLGETSQYFTPGPNTDPEPWLGGGQPFDRDIGTLEKGKKVYYKAHAHLQVGGGGVDNWEIDTQSQTGTAAVTFTWEDGQ